MSNGNGSVESSQPVSSPPPSSPMVELATVLVIAGGAVALCLTGHITGTEALAALVALAVPAGPVAAARRLLGSKK